MDCCPRETSRVARGGQLPALTILVEEMSSLARPLCSTSPFDLLHASPLRLSICSIPLHGIGPVVLHLPYLQKRVVRTTLPMASHRSMSLRSSASERTSVSSPLLPTHAMRPSV
jgi:hypothetical protein